MASASACSLRLGSSSSLLLVSLPCECVTFASNSTWKAQGRWRPAGQAATWTVPAASTAARQTPTDHAVGEGCTRLHASAVHLEHKRTTSVAAVVCCLRLLQTPSWFCCCSYGPAQQQQSTPGSKQQMSAYRPSFLMQLVTSVQ